MATPEKALLDLIYLQPGGDDPAFLKELRLNLDVLQSNLLDDFAQRCGVPKLRSSLLAGEVHAVLQRPYAKGRDWYDLIWYLSDPDWPPINLGLLNAALEQTGWEGAALEPRTWRDAVRLRLDQLNWDRLVDDVRPFLEHQHDVDLVRRDNVLRLLG